MKNSGCSLLGHAGKVAENKQSRPILANGYYLDDNILMTGYIREETANIQISIPFDIIGLCLLFYHSKPNSIYNTQISSTVLKLVHGVFSSNISIQKKFTKEIRLLISNPNNPPLQEIIDSGVIPRIIRSCYLYKHLELQYFSLWILLNITSGPTECIKYILKSNGHKLFIELLKCPLYDIQEEALWSLGNIAGENEELKDLLLNDRQLLSNILVICKSKYDEKYVKNFNNSNRISNNPMWLFNNLLSTCAWAISNLCRGSPPPNRETLDLLIDCLKCLLEQTLYMNDTANMNDVNKPQEHIGHKNEIFQNIAWSFSYLTGFDKYDNYLINKMNGLGILKQFMDLMNNKYGQVRHPTNRMFGNIFAGSDTHTQILLDLGILSKYKLILLSLAISEREYREIFWSLANICTSDNVNHKLLVLKVGLFKILIDYLQKADYDVSKEALTAIYNATSNCDSVIITHLVVHGVVKALNSFLQRFEGIKKKYLLTALECIENILLTKETNIDNTEQKSKFKCVFEESGIVMLLENITGDPNADEEVCEICIRIVKIKNDFCSRFLNFKK